MARLNGGSLLRPPPSAGAFAENGAGTGWNGAAAGGGIGIDPVGAANQAPSRINTGAEGVGGVVAIET